MDSRRTPSRPGAAPASNTGWFKTSSRKLFSRGRDESKSRNRSFSNSNHSPEISGDGHWMAGQQSSRTNNNSSWGPPNELVAAQEVVDEEVEDDWYRQYGELVEAEKEDEQEQSLSQHEEDDWYRQYGEQVEHDQEGDAYYEDRQDVEDETEEDDCYIEKIVSHRRNESGGLEFKVHWANTGEDEDEWFEKAAVAGEYPALLHKYEKRQGLGRRKRKNKGKVRSCGSPTKTDALESSFNSDIARQEAQLLSQRHSDAQAEMARQKRNERKRWQEEKRREKREAEALKRRQILALRKQGMHQFEKKMGDRDKSKALSLIAEARTAKRKALEEQQKQRMDALGKWQEEEEREQKILAAAFSRARAHVSPKKAINSDAPPAYEEAEPPPYGTTSRASITLDASVKWQIEKADLELERDAARTQLESLRKRLRQTQRQMEQLKKDHETTIKQVREEGQPLHVVSNSQELHNTPVSPTNPAEANINDQVAATSKWQTEKMDLERSRDAAKRQVTSLRARMQQLQQQLSEQSHTAAAPAVEPVEPVGNDTKHVSNAAEVALTKANETVHQQLVAMNQKLEAKDKQVAELEASMNSLEQQYEDMRMMSTNSAQEVLAQSAQVARLQAELQTSQERLQQERESGAKAAGASKGKAAKELARIKASLSELEKQLSSKQNETVTLQAELQQMQAQAANLADSLNSSRLQRETERARLDKEIISLKAHLQETQTELQDSNASGLKLMNELQEQVDQSAALEDEISANHKHLETIKIELSTIKDHAHAVQAQKVEAEAEIERMKVAHDAKLVALETSFASEVSQKDQRISILAEQANCADQIVAEMKLELSARKAEQEAKDEEYTHLKNRADKLEREQEAREHAVSVMRRKTSQLEEERREMHAIMQTLRGNVRVVCRVRPLLGKEVTHAAECGVPEAGPLQFPARKPWEGNRDPILLAPFDKDGITLAPKREQKHFLFDRVFQIGTTQETVFGEISKLVQSAIDGFNVCIFAYGQTGSGKTYTMMGPKTGEHMGVIPRTVDAIFTALEELRIMGWQVKVEASMLEIYNENIRDLLRYGPHDASLRYDIKHSVDGQTNISNLTIDEIHTAEDVYPLLKRADKNRATSATNMNEHSSRSHLVFQLRLSGHNPSTGSTRKGMLNLIDLAGSERLDRTGATGDRLKEAQAINKSLSCLGDVFASISNKGAHVPYRNSKLTFLLQYCLAPPSKTLMFVNVSPVVASTQETLCSLRFAAKVNNCDMSAGGGKGKPKKKKVIKGEGEQKVKQVKGQEGDDTVTNGKQQKEVTKKILAQKKLPNGGGKGGMKKGKGSKAKGKSLNM